MARYFIHLAYRGESFHGWQVQPNAVSVQSVLEDALSTLLRSKTGITGAGRTDTGVNAAMMIAHFDSEEIADTKQLVHKLNSIVGKDITIYRIFKVADDAHARFDATSRTYKYFVHTQKSPFLYPLSWHCHYDLDFGLMNKAAEMLLNVTDFTSFSKLHTDAKTNDCDVTHAKWERENGQWVFTITANRFLRNMVRAVVGTLVEVGRHKMTLEQFERVIGQKDRCAAGTSMPGNALFLWDITYPYPIN